MSIKTAEVMLSTGEAAIVQPMPYVLWCELEEARDEMLYESSRLVKEQDYTVAQACAHRFVRMRREKTLSACVRDWPRLRECVGFDDVLVLEKALEKLSMPELETENLSPAAAGAATPTA